MACPFQEDGSLAQLIAQSHKRQLQCSQLDSTFWNSRPPLKFRSTGGGYHSLFSCYSEMIAIAHVAKIPPPQAQNIPARTEDALCLQDVEWLLGAGAKNQVGGRTEWGERLREKQSLCLDSSFPDSHGGAIFNVPRGKKVRAVYKNQWRNLLMCLGLSTICTPYTCKK